MKKFISLFFLLIISFLNAQNSDSVIKNIIDEVKKILMWKSYHMNYLI